MRPDLLHIASELARRGEAFALATVVSRAAPVSAQVGDMALITRDGTFHGWVGGSCTRPTVIAEAARALEEGRPRLIGLAPDPETQRRPGLVSHPMTCHSGGSVEIHIQPVLPAPRLLVFGVSPTARALARLGKAMGYVVHAVDPHADAQSFPEADTVTSRPQTPDLTPGVPRYAVVATQGQWDEEALRDAAGQEPDYLAVVASPRRFAEMRALLASQLPEETLARIKNPAGLDLGAQGPEEVALSVLAEIVKERHAARQDAAWGSGGEAAERREAPGAARTAKDPICGMTVETRGAMHRAHYDGQDYFFCCAGCRERFVADPARYLAGAAGR
jgi:xanthine dehydrogenase accessory factor